MKPLIHSQPVGSAESPPQSRIQKTPGVCGGEACIRDTRITVWGLVEWRRLGLSDQEILSRVEGLQPEDLAAAWEYAGPC